MKIKHYVILLLTISLFSMCGNTLTADAKSGENKKSDEAKFYSFKANALTGEEVPMSNYKGKIILVVNTASKCGLTPQYAGLQELYSEYKNRGVVILGFPCNQFGGQEPGGKKEIDVCLANYGVDFDMFEKIEVNGENTHPLYKYLKSELKGTPGEKIKWNFTKFLIDADGKPIKRYAPTTKPEKIKKDIEKLLKGEKV